MTADTTNRPNIIFIYSDQLRADAIGCAGNRVVKTPHIDRLAHEGVRFENAFVSYPLCTPFRASLLTGKYAHATGVYSNHFPIPTDQVFLSTLLKNAGYHNGYIGKWHLYGGPKPGFVPPGEDRLDFDHFVGFNRGHEYMRSIFYRDSEQPYYSRRYEPDYQTDHLIEYMESCLSGQKTGPFFGYICMGPPHFPMDTPDYWKQLYHPDDVKLPHGVPNPELQREIQQRSVQREFAGDATLAESSKIAQRKIPVGEAETEAEIREFVAQYYGMVSNVDYNVGRILNWLDQKGLAEDTVVAFFSDHGDMFGQHGMYCGIKRRPYRGAMQVPVIVRFPARFPGGHLATPLIDFAIDTMPTILELCDIEIPNCVHGSSYLPLLQGHNTPTRDSVFYQLMLQSRGGKGDFHPVPRRGIRTLSWLYVREPDERELLFDLAKDPEEDTNLIDRPEHAATMDAFDAQIEQIMLETDDDWRREGDFPPPNFVTHQKGADIHTELLRTQAIEAR